MVRLVIDTNQYAGNFARQLCAYITGHIGDDDVGDEEQAMYRNAGYTPVVDLVPVEDEHAVWRPCEISPTPHIWNNGMGFHYREGQDDLALEHYRHETRTYWQSVRTLIASSQDHLPPDWTADDIAHLDDRVRLALDTAEHATQVEQWPAYQSVQMLFKVPPPTTTVEFLWQRATEFTQYWGRGLIVTGIRTEPIEDE